MSELLKLKLEELTYDIAAAKCIAIEQSLKDVEALRGGGGDPWYALHPKKKHHVFLFLSTSRLIGRVIIGNPRNILRNRKFQFFEISLF